jgi:NAD(P)-dependent dehydrogenase (short-subunit alcohol dehydrogenase family)
MHYFVTGGTGFIGRFLVPQLLRRGAVVYLLVREASLPKLDELRKIWQADHEQVVGVTGDLTEPMLGLSAIDQSLLSGKIDHFFHLAALYDVTAQRALQTEVNVGGTQQAVALAEKLQARHFHHMSSIAVAGLYRGTFREDMLEEAVGLDNPYLQSKHEAEKVVRLNCRIPWRIYRPGMVIGHSVTGAIDKIDGLYYSFKLIQKIRSVLPQWVPMIGLEGGRLNIVPVDYVVAAMAAIAHMEGEDRKCFHLTDPEPFRLGEILNIFCEAGHAPRMALRIDARLFGFIPPVIRSSLGKLPPLQRLRRAILDELGIPAEVLAFLNYPTRFDNREAERVLRGTGIEVPRLKDYAPAIWDYWERHLDPDLFRDRTLSGVVQGRVCMVTGGTSGIGLAIATRLVQAGAVTLIVARTAEALEQTADRLRALQGGEVYPYRADLADPESIRLLMQTVLQQHGRVDVLINNAGRSIRRSIVNSFDRLHDFERTMQLNYFGSLQLIMGFLPGMIENRKGHVINISSLGVLTGAPRFAAYIASKSALDAFSRCAAAEVAESNVVFTTVNMPLVRTPMISPTRIYDAIPALSPEAAADLVVDALLSRSRRIATPLGLAGQLLHVLSPRLAEILLSTGFQMFSDSEAARFGATGTAGAGSNESKVQTDGQLDDDALAESSSQTMLAALLRGLHW